MKTAWDASRDSIAEPLEEAFDYIDGIYDGAPDSPTRHLGSLLEKLRLALTTTMTIRGSKKG